MLREGIEAARNFFGMSTRRLRRPQPTTDQRSPEERLEALVREPNRERALRMLGRIRSDLDANPNPGPWIAAARALGERLIISESTVYYFVTLVTESLILAATDSDPELCRIRGEMDQIERAHGLLEDEAWFVGEGPPEWQELNSAWNRRSEEIVVTSLRELGHPDFASLLAQNPDEFEARSSEGYSDLWGKVDDELEPDSDSW